MLKTLTPWDIQAAQIMTGFTMVALLGCRYLPARRRWRAGVALTAAYIAGASGFVIHVLWR